MLVVLCIILISACQAARHTMVHYSDVARIKCDVLPYRAVYHNLECYFMLGKAIKTSSADAECSSVFSGAELATDVDDSVWSRLFLNKTTFHTSSDSLGQKDVLCVYGNSYSCNGFTSTSLPGKCAITSDNDLNYDDAVEYCSDYGGKLHSISNDYENKVVYENLVYTPAWIDFGVSKNKLVGQYRNFGRFASCSNIKSLTLGKDTSKWCSQDVIGVVDPEGYWELSDKKTKISTVCIRNATNEVFYKKEKSAVDSKNTNPTSCKELHTLDKSTGTCRWKGPAQACVQLTNFTGATMYINIPNYPYNPSVEVDLWKTNATAYTFNDVTIKAIVRNGCVARFYRHTTGGKYNEDLLSINDYSYGEHVIPSIKNGKVKDSADGLTRVRCACAQHRIYSIDGTSIKNIACGVAMHDRNKISGLCKWNGQANAVVQLFNNKNESMFVTIPGFPTKTETEIDLQKDSANTLSKFNDKVVRAIVRNGCAATFYNHTKGGKFDEKATIFTYKSYGTYTIPSFYNNMIKNSEEGLTRVSVSCDPKQLDFIDGSKPQVCQDYHKFNSTQAYCEKTNDGSKSLAGYCARVTNYEGKSEWLVIQGWPNTKMYDVNLWTSKKYDMNDRIIKIEVRQHCFATLYAGSALTTNKLIGTVAYGTYGVPSIFNKDKPLTVKEDGVTRIQCECVE